MSEPRLILLHPAGVTPAAFAKLVGPIEGFTEIYPQATKDLRWQHLGDSPDVAALMKIEADFIAGMSSGSFMAARMLETKTYRGAAMVAGGFINALKPRPTPLMLINGTLDAQVPYAGSTYVLGAQATATKMRGLLGLPTRKVRTVIDTDRKDGCNVDRHDWSGRVILYQCNGAGHTWPTLRTVWQPPELGRVCHDFDATAQMVSWFKGLA